ncbi:MAG: 50S ribosomal protein L25 [bacterium]
MQLQVVKRDLLGKKAKKLLKKGMIPAVLYGHDVKNTNIAVKANDFVKIYKEAGESTLIDLKIENSDPVKAIVQETQLNLSGEKFVHIDFHQINMDEKMTVNIGLKFTGIAPVVKIGGTVITNLSELSAECLPKDLVHEIEVDLSSLDDFEKNILVKDIKVPSGVKILNEAAEAIVIVEAPRKEEEKPEAQVLPAEEGEKKVEDKDKKKEA